MSVINKMLRDLDKRNASRALDTVSLPDAGRYLRARTQAPRSMARAWALMILLGAVGAGTFWMQLDGNLERLMAQLGLVPVQQVQVTRVAPLAAPPLLASSAPVTLQAVAPLSVASAPAPAVPVPAAVAQQAASAPAGGASAALRPLVVAPLPQVGASKPVVLAAAPVVLAVTAAPKITPSLAPSSSAAKPGIGLEPKPVAASSVAAPPAAASVAPGPTPPDAASNISRQQQAVRDSVAQAQVLWNAGSREGAMSVLQQVISNLERSPEGGGAGFALPVRELARMQLADARPGAAWELLTRLESQLGNDPESWALRGNAAQRLGRHQDSANAYQAALQLRPNEQRWLLGAAVSLAALGQAAAAGDMTDKARAVGPVAKDVLAYLRQMGVPVKD